MTGSKVKNQVKTAAVKEKAQQKKAELKNKVDATKIKEKIKQANHKNGMMQGAGQMMGGMGSSEMASTGDPERMLHEQHLMMKIK